MAILRRTGRLLVVALALLLAGCGRSGSDRAGGAVTAKPTVLTLANFLASSEEFDAYLSEVRRLSHGTIRIDVRNSWRDGEPGFEHKLIADVRAGKTDLGAVGSRAFDSEDGSLRALTAPLLVDNYDLQQRVLSSPLGRELLEGLSQDELQGIGVLPGPLRIPLGVAHPLTGPASYRGLRIGVGESAIAVATMRALGAEPIPKPSPKSIAGLDAIEEQLYVVVGARHDELARHLTANVVLWPRPLVLFASRAAFARLSVEQRRILRQAAANAVAPVARMLQRQDRDNGATLCRRGAHFVVASDDQRAALRAAVQPVYDRLERDPGTADAIRRIAAMRGPDATGSRPACAPAPTTTRATPLDGVWRMRDRIGDNPSDPEPVAENYGDWVLVLERGRFAFNQHYRDACTWGFGTFTLSGRAIAWSILGGGGIAPNGAVNQPGEFGRNDWSLYRDTLTMSGVKGSMTSGWFVKPWQRVSATPSARYLDRLCPPPAQALSG